MNGRTLFTRLIPALFLGLIFLAPTKAAERVIHYHNDALGSPIAATDQEGRVVWRKSYTPYGQPIDQAAPAEPGYTGKFAEPDLGIQNFGARWYDPSLGRFLSLDPAGFDETNPQSFNRYAYANNNPYKYLDPDGRVGLSVHAFQRGLSLNDAQAIGGVGNFSLLSGAAAGGIAASLALPELGAEIVAARALGALGRVADDVARGATKNNALEGVPVETFQGSIHRRVLQNDVEAFRYSGGASDPRGRFLTTRQTIRRINSSEDAQRVLQLPAEATAEKLNSFKIPKGTEIFVGRVRGGPAGASQVFIKDPGVLR